MRRPAILRFHDLLTILLGLVLALGHSAVPAQTSAAMPVDLIRDFVTRQSVAVPGKIEVTVGEIDSRLQLAACASVEPYLPAGARLWGRSNIGLRCVKGAHWNVLMPITVNVYGSALVAQRPLAAGAATVAEDFKLTQTELTREPNFPIADAGQLSGQVLTRSIQSGQMLRTDHLRPATLVAVGEPVKVKLVGEGFAISTEGIALAPGVLGQGLRVRMESGKIISGVVRDKFIEIRL